MICGTEWDMRNMMPSDMATMPRFCEFYPQEDSVHTRWQRYPKDGVVGVFSYIMSTLPTRWWRGRQFCLQDGGVSGSLPTRWRRAYKMAAFLGVYPQYGGVPTKWRHYPQDGSVLTRWRCYQQDGGFTHKMPTRWRQCRVSASFTHKIAAWEFFSYKMSALPTRWWLYHKMVTRQFCLQDGGFLGVYLQDGGVTNKMVALPTRCLQDGDSAAFLRVLPAKQLMWQ